ncbi:nitrate ABC transporter permease [Rhodococcus opacus PD630]|uniref:ABC transporter permease n=1 Tax=Rhodococcus TaxID=1827 RepID=UPI00029CC0FE|nr:MULTISPECIES: ABC transporter permease [Rhodococcus]KXF49468.1 ABC transporter permease [Rhodococcus sp. SC4]NDV10488.1 ABC transporter permease [Rhodococcus sp. IEGM 248]AHK31994.1 putative ABC transporter permease protein ytlD [Rhodococcus opacus PD630]EHI45273.1 nitrate ABC transporter permease [Rhodococcus opacus PD630]KXX56328.1 ABC transporter permease [Rhodococcus sp. LB1]
MHVIDQPSASATAASGGAELTRRTWKMPREMLMVRGAQILVGLAWLGLWQLTADRKWLDPVLAKTPGQSWDYLVTAARSGELWTNTRYTMVAVLIAWVVAGAIGVIVGVALGLLPRVERVLTPYLDAANAMPRIALAPLFIVALGINTSAKVALASTLVFFIVMSGARAGVRSTDAEWLRLSTVLGANKYQMFLKVLIPVATPAIFAALRLGLIYSLLGVVGSELISARNGLGQLIATYSATFQMEAVYAILLFLAVIAVVLNQVMSHAERRFLRWQPPVDR